MQLTTEQEAILATNENLVINAVAGSGKTTTLVSYAASRLANSKILYIAFNKTVKSEAIQKFAAAGLTNVRVETAHSLAYDHIMRAAKYELVAGFKTHELCEILKIKTGDRQTDYIIANHVNKFISYFCNSDRKKVQDLNYADTVTDEKARKLVQHFYKSIEAYTRTALARMEKGEMPISHDFYLKKFQLSEPVLNYDYILFDEGQDASGSMLDIFLRQPAIKVLVGDTHQQIYGWRYAVNSLQKVNFPVFNLSNSFRFNDEIALVANKLLALKKNLQLPPAVNIVGAGTGSAIISTRATLGRTNLALLVNAITQMEHRQVSSIYFEGNINSYTFADEGASLYDVLNLYTGKTTSIRDKLIAGMKSMYELEEYIQKTEDTSLAMIVQVVKEYGGRLPSLIRELKANHAEDRNRADMIYSTVHRCKGMEYDEVTLLNDFMNEERFNKQIAQAGGEKISEFDRNRLAEEINILYVAATRAKSVLKMPPELSPLKSLQLVAAAPALTTGTYSYRNRTIEDWDMFQDVEMYKARVLGKSRGFYSRNKKKGF